jgi:hypothetical protein
MPTLLAKHARAALEVGAELTCSDGTWEPPGGTISRVWFRDDEAIPGVTDDSYTLATADIGAMVRAIVTSTNDAGSGSAVSNEVGPVLQAPPINTTLPIVTPNPIAIIGDRLITSNGIWDNAPTSYTYAWRRDGFNYHDIVADDIGTTLICIVTATNSVGSTPATSNGVAATDDPPEAPVNTVPPFITGNTVVGSNLTCQPGTWTGPPQPTYTYQFTRDDVPFGTPGSSRLYTLAAGDVGTMIGCLVKATNVEGSADAVAPGVGPITTTPPLNTVPPSITGSTIIGGVLTCARGTWTGGPAPTYTYQWKRDGTTNIGTSATTYATVLADETFMISCTVTATNIADIVSADAPAVGPITDVP